ncbi:MAG: porin family protein [Bacteroidota bacterium]
MKKILLVFVCALFISFQSNAQAGFRLGLKGGLNFANLDTDIDTDSRTGFHAGAFATIKLTKFAIQPEIIFSQQGSEIDINGSDLESNFSYINIPVMLKLYLIGGLNLQLGPQFGFLASAKQDAFDIITGNVREEDIKSDLKGSDVSLGLGAGIDLPFGLTADARYNLGLSEIDDAEAIDATKNQVFQISVGYRFIDLGK